MLKVDWCTHEAAKYACMNWHYSKCLPVGKLVKVGAWENEKYIGCVVFGRGANNNLLKPYGLEQDQGCELVRIALTKHEAPVSQIMMIAIKFLKKTNKDLKLIVSFADAAQGHHGGIYQATNWIYSGMTVRTLELFYLGRRWHTKSFHSTYGSYLPYLDKGCERVYAEPKHRYLMPLDRHTRKRILQLSQPYPKRLEG